VIELLSNQWGVYLNASSDDRGSADMVSLLNHRKEMKLAYDHQSLRLESRSSDTVLVYDERVSILMDGLLFARLSILERLLKIDSTKAFTPERWMLLQVRPYVFAVKDDVTEDIFDNVFNHIVLDIINNNINPISLTYALREQFRRLKGLLRDRGVRIGTDAKFLMVLDEAQVLRDIGLGDYVSTRLEEERPVLSPVLHGLRHISMSEGDYCVIPCGTGLSHYDLEWIQNSGSASKVDPSLVSTPLDKRMINFSGWEDKGSIEKFIRHIGVQLGGDVPRNLNTWLPPEAINQLFRRLRWRFRPIITAVEMGHEGTKGGQLAEVYADGAGQFDRLPDWRSEYMEARKYLR